MGVYRLEIESDTAGRSFQGIVLAYALAPGLFALDPGAYDKPIRPISLMVACTPGAARPMLENLRGGRKAKIHGAAFNSSGSWLELCKSAGYNFPPMQTAGDHTVITAYLPEVFHFTPGLLDETRVMFALTPAREDVEEVTASADLPAVIAHLNRLRRTDEAEAVCADPLRLGLAIMTARYMGQRCEYPIPMEDAFAMQLFVAMRDSEMPVLSESLDLWMTSRPEGRGATARRALGFRSYVAPDVGMLPGVAVSGSHERIATILAAETRRFETIARRHAPRTVQLEAT